MLVIPAVFKDNVFVPEKKPAIPEGTRVHIQIKDNEDSQWQKCLALLAESDDSELANNLTPELKAKLVRLAEINERLEESNRLEPLPPEFDEILSHRFNIAREINL